MVMDLQSKVGQGHGLTFGLLYYLLLRHGCLYLLVGVTDDIDLFPGIGHVVGVVGKPGFTRVCGLDGRGIVLA